MILLLTLTLCFVRFVASSDQYNLTTGCYPNDTCQVSFRHRRLDVLKEFNCLCDKLCTEYGDCCHDAGHGPVKKDVRFGCHVLKQFGGVYVIDTCKTEWRVLSVQEKCKSEQVLEDPIGNFPVTNKDTGVTYRNFYCALCNDDVDNLQLWSPRLDCVSIKRYNDTYGNVTSAYVLQNLEFDEFDGWGVYLPSGKNRHFYNCMVDPYLPQSSHNKIRQCIPDLTSDCAPDWKNHTILELCKSYMGAVYYAGVGFRNVHCAVCNHYAPLQLTCQPADGRGHLFRTFRPHPFALLFDFDRNRGKEVGVKCKEGQVYDIFFKTCRSLECSFHQAYEDGRCVPDTKEDAKVNKSESVEECLKIRLSSDQFVMYDNQTVFVAAYNRYFNFSDYIIDGDNLLLCVDVLNDGYNSRFSEGMGYVTIVGLYLSIISLVLYVIIFCLCPDLHNLSGKNLMSLVASLLPANLFFVIGQYSHDDRNACAVVGVITYYFFLGSFFWMNVLAFDVWRTLRMATTELRVLSGGHWKRFLAYSSYAWLLAACIASAAAGVDNSSTIHEEYRPHFGIHHCWFGKRTALLIFFGGPVSLVMVINVILFTLSTRMILSASLTASNKRNNASKRDYKLYLRLALIMGLSWISGIIAGFVDRDVVWYIFILLTTLQGVFIFVAFGCNKKVWNSVRLRMKSVQPITASTSTAVTKLSRLTSLSLRRSSVKDV